MIQSFLAIPLLLCTAFIIPIIGVHKKKLVPHAAVTATLLSFILALLTIEPVMKSRVLAYHVGGWFAPYGIAIVLDPFALTAITLITFTGFLVTLFSVKFIRTSHAEYYSLLCLLLVGLLGVTHTGDLFNMFVFIEITSISSYALTAFYVDRKSIEASVKYLVMGAFATSLILLGTALAYGLTGTLNMADIAQKLHTSTSPTISVIVGLLVTGLAFKSAIVPLHAWKPDVLEGSPAPVGALFASASATASIYLIIRLLNTVFTLDMSLIMLAAGTVTMIVGALLAMQQQSIMRLLAYSAISQVGYILIAFATDSTSGIYHLFNVTIIEALLFLSAGARIASTKETSMEALAKYASKHPIIKNGFLVGILSNAGMPFTNGFSSKWLIYVTTLESYPLVTIAAVLTSVLTLAYSVKAYHMIFGTKKNAGAKTKPDLETLIPIAALALICIYFGVFAGSGAIISGHIAESLADNSLYIKTVLRL